MTISRKASVLRPAQLCFVGLYVFFLLNSKLDVLKLRDVLGPGWWVVVRYAVLATVGVIAFRDAWGRSVELTRQHPWRSVLWAVIGIVAGEVFPLIPWGLLSAMGWLPGTGLNDAAVASFGALVPAWAFFATVAVLGPVTEELVFRETLVQRAGAWVPRWIALLVSSALFGLLHVRSLEEIPLILAYGSVGLAYGLVLVASRGNLFVPLVGHATHNALPAILGLSG